MNLDYEKCFFIDKNLFRKLMTEIDEQLTALFKENVWFNMELYVLGGINRIM
jgi:hypothetical protein